MEGVLAANTVAPHPPQDWNLASLQSRYQGVDWRDSAAWAGRRAVGSRTPPLSPLSLPRRISRVFDIPTSTPRRAGLGGKASAPTRSSRARRRWTRSRTDS